MQNVTEERWKYIGGSDIPAVMGISTFKSRFDLLLEKAQFKNNDFNGNEYTEYGNIMEEKIRDYINFFYKKNFLEDKVIKDDLRYHSDGFDGETVLEIKTTSVINDDVREYKRYLVQLLFGMQMHNVKKGLLAVYQRPVDFDTEFTNLNLYTYDIEIDDYKDLLQEINDAVEQFRIDLKRLKENPSLIEQDFMPPEVVECANKLEVLERKLEGFKIIEKHYKQIKEFLFKLMTRYNIKKWETPNGTKITRVDKTEDKIIKVTKFDEERFMKDHPELYKDYLVEDRQIKKGKAGYVLITTK